MNIFLYLRKLIVSYLEAKKRRDVLEKVKVIAYSRWLKEINSDEAVVYVVPRDQVKISSAILHRKAKRLKLKNIC